VFALDLDDDALNATSEKIEVYEDSKERIPTMDPDEDNPFLDIAGSQKPRGQTKPAKNKSARDARMEAAVQNDEGIIYVL
jgi:hypothetical protein